MDPVSRAQNSESTGRKKVVGRPFPKGVSGNPGGRPKKLHITKMYEKLLSKPHNRKEIMDSLLKILTSGRMAAVLLAREMAERTEGKVAQELDVYLDATIKYADTVARIRARKAKIESD